MQLTSTGGNRVLTVKLRIQQSYLSQVAMRDLYWWVWERSTVSAPEGQAASKGKRLEGRAHIAPSDLSIHIRSCPFTGVEYVDGEEPSMKPQEREAHSNGNGTEIMGMPFLVCCGCSVSSMKYNLCSSKVEWELKRHLWSSLYTTSF